MGRKHKLPDVKWSEANGHDKYGFPTSGRYRVLTLESIKLLKDVTGGDCGFIMADELLPTPCDFCKDVITPEQGNRAHYYPKEQALIVEHYECSWTNLLGKLHAQTFGDVHVSDPKGREYVIRPDGTRYLMT